MENLATLTDLEYRLAGGIPDGKEQRCEALLRDASATVRRCAQGQQFTAGTSTEQLVRPRNGIVRLPQRPVTAVDAVIDLNGNDVLFTWEGDDRVSIAANVPNSFAFEPWRNGINAVKVTYSHGYDEIPDDIIAVVCQIAGRALGRTPEEAGVTQESIAGYSYSVGAAAGAGPLGMLPDERRVIESYTRNLGAITIGH